MKVWQSAMHSLIVGLGLLLASAEGASMRHAHDVVIQGEREEEAGNVAQPWRRPCLDNHDVRIEVLPNIPTEGESITLRISGTSSDSCVPGYVAHEFQGNSISVYAGEPTCNLICNTVLTPWAFDVPLGLLPLGVYTVRFYLVCGWPLPTPPSPGRECSLTTFTVAPCYDLNGNGRVDTEDVQTMVNLWHQHAGLPHDCDGDGFITARDIMCAAARWGMACPQSPLYSREEWPKR